jgi:hypothetical protein
MEAEGTKPKEQTQNLSAETEKNDEIHVSKVVTRPGFKPGFS